MDQQPFLPPSTSTLEVYEDQSGRARKKKCRPALDRQDTKTYIKSSRIRRVVLCIALHAGLVLVHIGLFIVWSHHYEHLVTVDIDTAASIRLPLIVTVVSQVLGTVSVLFAFILLLLVYICWQIYLALLVLATQQLSLQRDLQTRQTLTAIHDKSAAWLGLAASVSSLWQQFKIPTAVWGVLHITLYLGGIFALHITVPSLFHVVPFNTTIQVQTQTQLARSVVVENEVIK